MKKIVCLFVVVCKLSFSQNQDIKGLIEYVHQDSLEIIANIIIPSFETIHKETIPTIVIERKEVLWFELHFIKKTDSGIRTHDTCFIATYNVKNWEGIDPIYAESPCVNDDNYCHIIINDIGEYTLRFREGNNIRSYRLIIKK